MGSQWVEDPSWGNIFKSLGEQFASAPEEALKQRLTVEQIKAARQDNALKALQLQQGTATGNAYEQAVPQASVPPVTRSTLAPFVGDPNNPADTKDVPMASYQYTDPQALASAQARRNLAIAANKQLLMTHPEQAIPQLGYGTVAATGVPKTADERAQLEFFTTGKFPTAKDPAAAHNLVEYGPDGKPTGMQYGTRDGVNDLAGNPIPRKPGHQLLAGNAAAAVEPAPDPLRNLVEIGPDQQPTGVRYGTRDGIHDENGDVIQRKPGHQYLAGGDASQERPSTLSDKGKMNEEFAALAGRVNRGETLTFPDIERAHVLREQLYPQSASLQNIGGRQQFVTSRPLPVPDYGGRLSDLIDGYRNGDHLQPASAPQPGGANAPRLGAQQPGNPAELRKEIMMNTQSFPDYATAIPSYNIMIKAAQGDPRTGMPNSASDLNIIYAVAKLFDPGSVVREGELKLAAGTAPIAAQLQSAYSRLFSGEGSLTPEIRANLIGEGMKRMEQYKAAKDLTTAWYTDIAKRQGLDPSDVIPPLPDMLPYDRQAIQNPSANVLDQADHLVGGGR